MKKFTQFISSQAFLRRCSGIKQLGLLLFALLLFYGNNLYAQTPFSCSDGASYQIKGNPSALYTVNLRTGAATSLFTAASLGSRNLTGLGYNVSDNFLYASISGTSDIVKIGSDGTVTQITVPGLPAAAYAAGDVTVIGGFPYLYLYTPSATTMRRINLNTLAVSSITLTQGANVPDISIDPTGTYIYGISANSGTLVSWPITGGALTSSAVGVQTAFSSSTFMDSTGDLFVIADNSSTVYEISGPSFPNTNSLTRVTPALTTASTNTDGARCVTSLATIQPAFGCLPNQAFVSTSGTIIANSCDAIGNGQSVLAEYNVATGTIVSTSAPLIQTYGDARTDINNLGYNPTDNYLWAYRFATNQLVRIGLDRSIDFFAIPGLSNNCLHPVAGNIDNTFFFSGDVNSNGVMYLLNGIQGDRFIRVDLNPSSPTYLTKLSDVLLTPFSPGAGTIGSIQDLAFNPIDGLLYTIDIDNRLLRIDPTSGVVTIVGPVTGTTSDGRGYLVAYFDNAGTLYVQKANNTTLLKVPNVATGGLTGSSAGTGASFSGGDGARCPFSPIAPILYSLSGNVFNDGNGLNDVGGALVNTTGVGALNPVNGATSLGTQLYVTIVNSDGNPLATVPVSTTGTYTFPDLAPGSYSVVLSTNPAGTTSPNSPLATDWASTGEQLGLFPGGTDGTPNGILTGISITNANVINANLGINKKPVVESATDLSRANPGGTTQSPVTSTVFQGSDQEDGSYTSPANPANNNLKGRTVNLEPGTGGDVYYNGVLVTANDAPISNFDPALVSVDPAGSSNQSTVPVTFSYTVTDNAGVVSDPKIIQVPFTSNPLPVTLISFNVKKGEGTSAVLEWATTEETNSDKFEIEHSVNGKNWNLISFVFAKGGSKELTKYHYTHTTPVSGENLYRLKMIDMDGTYAHSRIQSVKLGEGLQSAFVFPNPASEVVKLGNQDLSKISKVEIIDTNGKVVYRSAKVSSDGVNVSNLRSGIYLIRISQVDGSRQTQKIVISR